MDTERARHRDDGSGDMKNLVAELLNGKMQSKYIFRNKKKGCAQR